MKRVFVAGSGQFTTSWLLNTNKIYRNFVVSKNPSTHYSTDYFVEDLSDIEKTSELVKHLKPDLIINAAAFTNIELCEKFPDIAEKSNTIIPKNLSSISEDLDIPLIHLSTDHFSSVHGELRDEEVKAIPINQYGKTKLQGEHEIIKNTQNFAILRTNFFSIYDGKNLSFLSKLISDLRRNKTYQGAIDYYFNPVSINFLINTIIKILDLNILGILNVTSDQCINKHQFAIELCEILKLNTKLIKKIEINDLEGLTQRPKNLCLDNRKLKNTFNLNEVDLFSQLKNLITFQQHS